MIWYAWVLVVLYALNMLAGVATIGKTYTRTKTDALIILIVNSAVVWAIVSLAT